MRYGLYRVVGGEGKREVRKRAACSVLPGGEVCGQVASGLGLSRAEGTLGEQKSLSPCLAGFPPLPGID